jgi:hypothetical protein
MQNRQKLQPFYQVFQRQREVSATLQGCRAAEITVALPSFAVFPFCREFPLLMVPRTLRNKGTVFSIINKMAPFVETYCKIAEKPSTKLQ